jgi:hypothetical protein
MVSKTLKTGLKKLGYIRDCASIAQIAKTASTPNQRPESGIVSSTWKNSKVGKTG